MSADKAALFFQPGNYRGGNGKAAGEQITVGPLIQYSSPPRLLPPPALPGGWQEGQ